MSTPPTPPPSLVDVPYNQVIAQKHVQVRRAVRQALGTVCDAEGRPKATPRALRRQLKFIQILAPLAGDNIIIPAGQAGIKMILEFVLWNQTGPNTLTVQQGQTGNNAITLVELTDFPTTGGFVLGFNGNWDMAHWEIDNGQPLILNNPGGTRVTGFVRYRVLNGTEA